MNDGAVLILLMALFALLFAVHSVRHQLKRIADFCERSEKRITGKDRP
jgi:hypothetical protein